MDDLKKKKSKTAQNDQEIEQLCLYICLCFSAVGIVPWFNLLIKSDDLRH